MNIKEKFETFTGTDAYHFYKNCFMTDGVIFFAENFHNAYIPQIALDLIVAMADIDNPSNYPIILEYKIDTKNQNGFVNVLRFDGDDRHEMVYTKKYPIIDFPVEDVSIYIQKSYLNNSLVNIACLSSER